MKFTEIHSLESKEKWDKPRPLSEEVNEHVHSGGIEQTLTKDQTLTKALPANEERSKLKK